jgi:tetratricopeptide (TPR) repeat protein
MLMEGNVAEDVGAEIDWLSLKARGDAFHKSRDYEAAVAAYNAALKGAGVLNSTHAVLYSNRAASHLLLERPLLALDDAEDAIKLSELQNVRPECHDDSMLLCQSDWEIILSLSLTRESSIHHNLRRS